MKLSCRVLVSQVYQGEKAAYLTGTDLETGGVFKVSGDFKDVPGYPIILLFEGTVSGAVFNNSYSLRAEKLSFKKVGEIPKE